MDVTFLRYLLLWLEESDPFVWHDAKNVAHPRQVLEHRAQCVVRSAALRCLRLFFDLQYAFTDKVRVRQVNVLEHDVYRFLFKDAFFHLRLWHRVLGTSPRRWLQQSVGTNPKP